MIIANFIFVCDICGNTDTFTELTKEHSQTTIRFIDMARDYSTIWIDKDNCDTICWECREKHWDLLHVQNNRLWWLERPTPNLNQETVSKLEKRQ